ncbi:MAG TPA: type II secretion system F family protein [Longimicrobiales bacterium]|nr:type II secretion system F family protein [Longimicrobiales bacterium]
MMTILWYATILAIAVGCLMSVTAIPQIIARRQVRARLSSLSHHPGVRAEVSAEASLLRPTHELRGWVALIARFPRIAGERQLHNSGVSWSVKRYLTLRACWAAGAAITVFLFTHNVLFAGIALVVGGFIPAMYVRRKKTKRLQAFESQLPDAVDLISRSLRAGHPLVHGLKMAGDDTPLPLAAEFRIAHEEHRFGMPLDEALVRLGERLELSDARILVTAILVQRDAGGNIAEVFERLANVMRERVQIKRQVQVQTAQGRMSGYVLSSLPAAIGILLMLVNPGYMQPLFDEPIGRAMLAGAVVMQIIGHIWIQKIVKIDV